MNDINCEPELKMTHERRQSYSNSATPSSPNFRALRGWKRAMNFQLNWQYHEVYNILIK